MIRAALRLLQQGDFRGFREATYLRLLPAVRWQGCWFYLYGVPRETRLQLLRRHYELDEISMLQYLDFTLPLVELGASSGVLGCISNRRLRDPNQHVLVEANPTLAKVIRINQFLNGASFELEKAVLAYGVTELDFPVDPNPIASSLYAASGPTARVRCTTLEDTVRAHGFKLCNLLCDVEGQEVELVRNELAVLQKHVSRIIIETHPKILGAERVAWMMKELDRFFEIEHSHGQVFCLKNRGEAVP